MPGRPSRGRGIFPDPKPGSRPRPNRAWKVMMGSRILPGMWLFLGMGRLRVSGRFRVSGLSTRLGLFRVLGCRARGLLLFLGERHQVTSPGLGCLTGALNLLGGTELRRVVMPGDAARPAPLLEPRQHHPTELRPPKKVQRSCEIGRASCRERV